MFGVILREVTILCNADASAPDIELHGLPELCLSRAVGGVEHCIDDVAIVEGLFGRTALLEGVESIGEHMVIAEVVQLVAYGKEPAGVTFRFFRDIISAFAGSEHLEAGAEEAVDPN